MHWAIIEGGRVLQGYVWGIRSAVLHIHITVSSLPALSSRAGKGERIGHDFKPTILETSVRQEGRMKNEE
jgi:hypothetical protein